MSEMFRASSGLGKLAYVFKFGLAYVKVMRYHIMTQEVYDDLTKHWGCDPTTMIGHGVCIVEKIPDQVIAQHDRFATYDAADAAWAEPLKLVSTQPRTWVPVDFLTDKELSLLKVIRTHHVKPRNTAA